MTELERIRVFIADDHALVRSGLKLFLQAFDDLELVGEASSGEEAVGLCEQVAPDVVLMDLMMPGMGGVAAAQAVRKLCPRVRVIALTNFQDGEMVQQALRAGVTSYLLKNVTAEELARAIRAAKAGHSTLAPEATQALIDAATHSPASPPKASISLTPREREVLSWMVTGLSNPEIAERLVLSPMTVKFHVSNILSKLGCSSRTEAVALAVGEGLVSPHTGAAAPPVPSHR
jgi:NarL family two-component system response regulator LiaR